MGIEKILIVDDEPLIRRFLAEALSRKGFIIEIAENGKQGLSLFKEKGFDLVISDLKMEKALSGLDLLRSVKETAPQTIFIIMTAFGTIENAVEAMRLGAFNYLVKPFTLDALEVLIEKAKEHVGLVSENHYLRQMASSNEIEKKIIAESHVMKQIIKQAITVAQSNASIMLHGESGTGKEVIAELIHNHSLRDKGPYIRVNCAAVPDTLVESEFFGHEKGSFTGAHAKRMGRFELAHKGSLFLDEVTEIPIQLQPKLLRAVQEQEFERVGGSKPLNVDVRIISSSNRNLKEAIEQKILREDLYYRLNVIPIHLPPLRERSEDIVPLAEYFLERHVAFNHKRKKGLTKRAKEKLLSYRWPGNVRELSNVIERSVVLDFAPQIEAEHLFIDT